MGPFLAALGKVLRAFAHPSILAYTTLAPPACTAQLLSRLLDAGALRSALPRFPGVPTLTALPSQLTSHTTPLRWLDSGSTFAHSFSCCFKDAVRARVSGDFSRAVEEF
jgi:hypothetical protein